ncbi:Transposase, IS607 family [Crocosphaera watsonii WH 0003]|uniref:Transposase, IS607 family n=3 Tax=Crocosphaera watsonii TaxID=263511 RepID=G5IYS3_CROWT|nr:Transposase, IS607 family [Crocosphaera watsonii WH 0003]CCQ58850.1 Predicted double-stranded RNA/RNA-DNA hybrid binding protein [Crocosphaera watsonii WH 0005]
MSRMHYRPSEFADLAGVSVKTLHRWDSSGKLKPLRTVGGHRYYTDEHINQIKGIIKNPRINVIYCRVSSNAQKPELSNQAEAMKQFCTANGITIDKVIKEIGGGLNFKRKKFLTLLSQVMTGQVESIYVAHKDRLCRFAFDLVEQIATINGTKIIVANNDSLSPQQELVEDMMAIIHCFSCRLYGTRNYKKKLKENLDKNLDKQLECEQEIQC